MKADKPNKIIVGIYYVLRTLMIAAALAFLWQREWSSAVYTALIFLLMISPGILKRWWDIYLPFELEITSVIFIFLTLFLGSLENFYEEFPWWDGVLHFGSGFLLGFFGFVFIYILNQGSGKLNLSSGFSAIFSVMFSVTIGAIWEIAEFIFDKFTGARTMETGLPDTMGDMIVNLIGAVIVATAAYIWMKREKRIPLTPKKIN
ncbi:hypothetical protein KW796_01330 [Candidatus Parcubacteria bacterium]|nr:hypothetical protein [Candidatus Parcubacteria bacterium]